MSTPCKECGYPLKGNETACPECGVQNIPEEVKPSEEEINPSQKESEENSQSESDKEGAEREAKITRFDTVWADECKVDNSAKKSRKKLWILTILIGVLIIGGGIGIFFYFDSHNPIAEAIQSERLRQDSLLVIADSIHKTQEMDREEERIALEQKEMEKAERNKQEEERIKKEEEEDKKRQAEARAEQERQEKELATKGPVWINGTWTIKTEWYNPISGRYQIVSSELYIDRDNQTLKCYLDNELTERGKYTISDGAIHCGRSYWRIDNDNWRLEFGRGKYYSKY